MAGFDCQFVERPPEIFQSECPVCLLVLREPHQVTCCGMSFCKECIMATNRSCPTCNQESFRSFPNLGLQQPLYGFRVFCSNKKNGCAWEGELRDLDQHINSDNENQLAGCGYTNVSCVYCEEQIQRQKIGEHQASLCLRRPYTCSMCEDYESTYGDFVYYHRAECKCRPVECPNSCGADSLQHQHLEEHVSSQCPLTLVECEFSEAGCAAMVYRQDLPSHLTDNIVTHMSLLAKENRKLKLQLKEQLKAEFELQLKEQRKEFELQLKQRNERTEEKLKLQLDAQKEQIEKSAEERIFLKLQLNEITTSSIRQPPINFWCPFEVIQDGSTWSSDSFRHESNKGLYDLTLHVKLTIYTSTLSLILSISLVHWLEDCE